MSLSSSRKPLLAIGYPLRVLLGFILAQALVYGLLLGLVALGVPLGSYNQIVVNTVANIVVYAITIGLVVFTPPVLLKKPTSLKEIGLHRLPTWKDLAWVPAGAVTYIIVSSLLSAAAVLLLPFVNPTQAQQTGFSDVTSQLEFVLAFISLVLVAPVAEETLFRGYLLGRLRTSLPSWLAILITSALFGLVHMQWNVGIDVFALSLVLCLLRIQTDSLWAPIVLHMIKNGVAFYFLFVNPLALSTIGG